MTDANILFSVGSLHVHTAQLVSMVLIVFLTYINTRGIQGGKFIQTTFTVTKLLSLFGLIVFGLLMAKGDVWKANWTDAWHMQSMTGGTADATTILVPVMGAAAVGAIAASMVGSIFSSDAWNNVTFIAGEIKNPKRNIGLSLFLGTLAVTLIYVSTNFMYLAVMPLHDIAFAKSDRVAVAASNVILAISEPT